jgi:predicted alpha/beta hydrolase family esterase
MRHVDGASWGGERVAPSAAVLIVPGLRDHTPDHWQTLLGKRLSNCRTVPPIGRENIDLDERIAAIESEAAKFSEPFVVVAHSAGCIMTAHWARQTRRPVLGALLAAPPDLETPMPAGYPTMAALESAGWLPVPRAPLPFPSIVASSRNDPLARAERVAGLAANWKSDLIDLGAVGHLNPASGYGDWPFAETIIHYLANVAYA